MLSENFFSIDMPWKFVPDDFSRAISLMKASFFLAAGQKWIAQKLWLFVLVSRMATSLASNEITEKFWQLIM